MTRTHRPRLGAVVLTLGIALGATACTGSSDSDPAASASPSPSAAPPLETTTRTGRVEGRLRPAGAQTVTTQVGEVVDGWIDAAYVGGDYPRDDFSDAFPGFTAGAAREAARDLALMSNAEVGGRVDAVSAKVRRVVVDVLGVRGRPAGATARVRLVFTTSGELEKRVTVTGELRLTRTADGWQVFAYDVARGSRS